MAAAQQQLLFEVSLNGLVEATVQPRLLDVLGSLAAQQTAFELEETIFKPAGWASRAEDGTQGEGAWLRVRNLTETNEKPRTFIVALQRPESARAQPQALVTPVLYTSVVAGGSGEEVVQAMGYQRTSSFRKQGIVFDFSVGLSVEVFTVGLSLSKEPSTHYVVEVRSPPAPHSAVAQIIGHALELKRRLVGLVALERMES